MATDHRFGDHHPPVPGVEFLRGIELHDGRMVDDPVALICLIASILFTVMGIRIFRVMKRSFIKQDHKIKVSGLAYIYLDDGMTLLQVLRNLTIVTISASGAFVALVIMTIILSVIRADTYKTCQFIHLGYRALEIMLVMVITWPLREGFKFRRTDSSRNSSSNLKTSNSIPVTVLGGAEEVTEDVFDPIEEDVDV